MTLKRKLIEVALPLEAINKEAAREKSIRHGHPSTLHLWWARRPLAACRAVLFASLVDDPSSHPDQFPTEEAQEKERRRLFDLIGRVEIVRNDRTGGTEERVRGLVSWEDCQDEQVLAAAQREIARSIAWTRGDKPPTKDGAVQAYIAKHAPVVLDPFCGGGSIPLEAQRLGLEAHASDLNPVAVLITKALIEIPPKFAGRAPVNPESRKKLDHSKTWRGAQGLAEDVRYYGQWMRDEAERRIGHLYPRVKLPKERGGGEATVIAWLWARTVTCPNPGCAKRTPLLTTFLLSSKKGKEHYLQPRLDNGSVSFEIVTTPTVGFEEPKKGLKRGISGVFACVFCGTVTDRLYVAAEGVAGRLGVTQTAVVAEGHACRIYLPAASSPIPAAVPLADTRGLTAELSPNPRDVWCRNFGLNTPADLFTPRQLVALTTFSDLVADARERIVTDAQTAAPAGDTKRLADAGSGAEAYADAVSLYLAFAVSRMSDYCCTIATWASNAQMEIVRSAFARQAIPMTWDFAEANPFGPSTGSLEILLGWIVKAIERLPARSPAGRVRQLDAAATILGRKGLVATDPPYYDNIGYADLSDFFYVWLRRSAGAIYPDVCSTLLAPKAQELVATAYRFDGDREKAERFFEEGLGKAFDAMRAAQDPEFPLTLFYAFKQAESSEGGEDGDDPGSIASTGWETMLEALLRARFTVEGTWPVRTERKGRSVSIGTNALASSVVLVTRPRSEFAPLATRKEFLAALKRELPEALKRLQHGNIAPVDLAQAAIGPGMAVFSRYSKVVEADGSRMPVRTALGLINQVLDEVLAEQESEFDADTRWALAWFEQYGMNEGPYGDAETLSKAKDTSVDALRRDGLLASKRGKVQLLRRDELPSEWNPAADSRLTVWELTQHLIRRLEAGGESASAELLKQVGSLGDVARDLAYRLYSLCERKGWAQEATAYNGLVTAWPELTRLASQGPPTGPAQPEIPGMR